MIESVFGALMKRFRKQRGWTQAQLGKACGLTAHYIHLLETGKRPPPSRRSILLIATALELAREDARELTIAAGVGQDDTGGLLERETNSESPDSLYGGIARHLFNAGDLAATLGENNQAISYLKEALVVAQKTPDRALATDIRAKLGQVYRVIGNYTLAQKEYFESRLLAREIKDKRREAAVLRGLGIAYKDQGYWAEAEECQKTALDLARQISDRHSEGRALNNLGWLSVLQGKMKEADDYLKADLQICLELGDVAGAAVTLMNIGNYLLTKFPKDDLDSLLAAKDKYSQALELMLETRDTLNEAKCRNNLSALYGRLADVKSEASQRHHHLEQALAYSQEAYRSAHEARHASQLEGEAQLSMAEAYSGLGDLRLADDCYKLSRTIFHAIDDTRGEIECLLSFIRHIVRAEPDRRTDLIDAVAKARETICRADKPQLVEKYSDELDGIIGELSPDLVQDIPEALGGGDATQRQHRH